MAAEAQLSATERIVQWGLTVLLLLVGLWLRVAAAAGDLGIDEIWSLRFASLVHAPLDVFGLKHDNNHILNTLWLAALGPDQASVFYRAPSVLAGVGAIALASLIARRSGRPASWATAALFCVCMLLVNSGSEARGYSLAVAMVGCSVWLLERRLDGSTSRWLAPSFCACSVLAMLAHLSSVSACGAIGCYWLIERLRAGDRRVLLTEALTLQLVPALAAAWLAVAFVHGMQRGGGPANAPQQVLIQTGGLLFGLGIDSPTLGLGAFVTLGLGLFGLLHLFRQRDRRWVLYSVGIIFPLLALAAYDITYAAPRYLLMSVFFFLLALGAGLGAALSRPGVPRVAGACLLGTILALNLMGDLELGHLGRGSFSRGVEFIIKHSDAGPISIASDQDFRNAMLLSHFARFYPDGERIVYFVSNRLPPEGVDWLILHRVYGGSPPEDALVANGDRYARRIALPAAGPSGISWFIYRREGYHRGSRGGNQAP
jgi:hypothetical protein